MTLLELIETTKDKVSYDKKSRYILRKDNIYYESIKNEFNSDYIGFVGIYDSGKQEVVLYIGSDG